MRRATEAPGKTLYLVEANKTWENGLPATSGQMQMDIGQTLGLLKALSASCPAMPVPLQALSWLVECGVHAPIRCRDANLLGQSKPIRVTGRVLAQPRPRHCPFLETRASVSVAPLMGIAWRALPSWPCHLATSPRVSVRSHVQRRPFQPASSSQTERVTSSLMSFCFYISRGEKKKSSLLKL